MTLNNKTQTSPRSPANFHKCIDTFNERLTFKATALENIRYMHLEEGINDSTFSFESLARYYPDCSKILSVLNLLNSKIRFDQSSNHWERYYVLPQKNDIDKFIQTFEEHNESDSVREHLINKDKKSIKDWVRSMCINSSVNFGSISYVLGSPGSGKSSCIKYSMVKHNSIYYENNVIPTRVEYSKIKDVLSSNNLLHRVREGNFTSDLQKAICSLITTHMLRDLLVYIRDKELESTKFTVVETFIQSLFSPDNKVDLNFTRDEARFNAQIESVRKSMTNSSGIISIHSELKAKLFDFATKKGISFSIVFDGFDVISPQDIIVSSYNRNILELLKTLIETKWLRKYSISYEMPLRVNYIVVLRSNTFKFLDLNKLLVQTARPIWYVVPPNIKQLVRKRLAMAMDSIAELSGSTIETGEKNRLVSKLCESVHNTFQEEKKNRINTSPKTLIEIVNGDCRAFLRYVKDMMIYALYWSRSEAEGVKNNSLIEHIFEVLFTLQERHRWIYKFILISGLASHFKCYFRMNPESRTMYSSDSIEIFSSVRDKNGDKVNEASNSLKFIFENVEESPPFDNIFNYIPLESLDGNNFPSILLKYHILMFVNNQSYNKASVSEIKSCLNDFGYKIEKFELKSVLAILLFSQDLIWQRNGTYKSTDKSVYTLNQLITSFDYISEVCYFTNIPHLIGSQFKKFYKKRNLRVPVPDMAKICTMYFFIEYICYVESKFFENKIDNRYLVAKSIKTRFVKVLENKLSKWGTGSLIDLNTIVSKVKVAVAE